VSHIIDVFPYQNVCASWVPHVLTAEMKSARVEICQQHYKNEDEEFLHNIMTANKTWLPHCEAETKRQSVKKKFKTQALAGKVLAMGFFGLWCYSHGLLEPETTTNPECFIAILKTLKR
jgi:hypothetical protein